jgi:hypothetical protein
MKSAASLATLFTAGETSCAASMASGADVIAYRPHIRFPEPLPLGEG